MRERLLKLFGRKSSASLSKHHGDETGDAGNEENKDETASSLFVTVTAFSGPGGTVLTTYQVDRRFLVKYSQFFKIAIRQRFHNASSVHDGIMLPIPDTYNVFPLIVHFLTTGKRKWTNANKVHVCYMAYKCELYHIVHICRQELRDDPISDVIYYLQVASKDIDCDDMVKAITSALAKRFHEAGSQLFALQTSLMEGILKTQDFDVMKAPNMVDYIERYIDERDKTFHRPLSTEQEVHFRLLAKKLKQLRESIERIHIQASSMDLSKTDFSPFREIKSIKEQHFRSLKDLRKSAQGLSRRKTVSGGLSETASPKPQSPILRTSLSEARLNQRIAESSPLQTGQSLGTLTEESSGSPKQLRRPRRSSSVTRKARILVDQSE